MSDEKFYEYSYGNFSIKLPVGHMLPAYQSIHPKYDRFLPHLVKYLANTDTVVDVGANVGDTLASMVMVKPCLNFICIEPDEFFYNVLKENINIIKKSIIDLRVDVVQALVGKTLTSVSLEGIGGTKHAVLDSKGSIKSIPLDDILSKQGSIKLIKTDTDGFDYDVLDSAMSAISYHSPMIFFECEYRHDYQLDGYRRTLKSLEEMGYSEWIIFDNFGEVVLRTNEITLVYQLMNYVWKQNLGHSTRTIYYFDILTAKKNYYHFISEVMSDYHRSTTAL